MLIAAKGMFMSSDDEKLEDDASAAPDDWEEFRDGDGDPISLEALKHLNLKEMPEDISASVLDDYFPETTLNRDGEFLVCEIEEHLYTKHWEHKFSAYAFAEAMERAVRRLEHEGHPLSNPTRDAEDVHIFVRWHLRVQLATPPESLVTSIKSSFDLVWQRADAILENSDSVLILGKDTGSALDR